MSLQLSNKVLDSRTAAIAPEIGTSPVLKLFSGAPPASCADADSGTELWSLALPADWLSAVRAAGAIHKGYWWANASASGTAGHFRLYSTGATTCHLQGTVTATGGGGDLTVDNATLTSGSPVVIDGFEIFETPTAPFVTIERSGVGLMGEVPTAVSASGPLTVSTSDQTIENLVIWGTSGEAALKLSGATNAVIRNCLVIHYGCMGIYVLNSANVRAQNVWVFHAGAPQIGPNDASETRFNWKIEGSDSFRGHRLRVDKGSAGFYCLNSDGSHFSMIEGHDMRGPFPRGQLIQWDTCTGFTIEDFSIENPIESSWPEDSVNAFKSTGGLVRRGLIVGNNSSNGWGVIFDGGYDDAGVSGATGLVEDVDAVNCANGGFSTFAGGIGNTFRRCRVRDDAPLGVDGSGYPLHNRKGWNNDGVTNGETHAYVTSTGLGFSATLNYDTQAVIEDCRYFNLANQTVWPETTTGNGWNAIDLTSEDFTPRAPIRLEFPGFANVLAQVPRAHSSDTSHTFSMPSVSPASALSVLAGGGIIANGLAAADTADVRASVRAVGNVSSTAGGERVRVAKRTASAVIEDYVMGQAAGTPTAPNVRDASASGLSQYQMSRKANGGLYCNANTAYTSGNAIVDLGASPDFVYRWRFANLNAGGAGQSHGFLCTSSPTSLPYNGGTQTGYGIILQRWSGAGAWTVRFTRYDGASLSGVDLHTLTIPDGMDVATVEAEIVGDMIFVTISDQRAASYSFVVTDRAWRGRYAGTQFNIYNVDYAGTVAAKSEVTFAFGRVPLEPVAATVVYGNGVCTLDAPSVVDGHTLIGHQWIVLDKMQAAMIDGETGTTYRARPHDAGYQVGVMSTWQHDHSGDRIDVISSRVTIPGTAAASFDTLDGLTPTVNGTAPSGAPITELRETATTGNHRVRLNNFTVQPGETVRCEVEFRMVNAPEAIRINAYSGTWNGSLCDATFVADEDTYPVFTDVSVQPAIVAVPGNAGWFRARVDFYDEVGRNDVGMYLATKLGGTASYAGDVTRGIDVGVVSISRSVKQIPAPTARTNKRYVGPAGSDGADGLTAGTAWATLSAHLASIPSDCEVIYLDGTSTEASGRVVDDAMTAIDVTIRPQNFRKAVINGNNTASSLFRCNDKQGLEVWGLVIREVGTAGVDDAAASGVFNGKRNIGCRAIGLFLDGNGQNGQFDHAFYWSADGQTGATRSAGTNDWLIGWNMIQNQRSGSVLRDGGSVGYGIDGLRFVQNWTRTPNYVQNQVLLTNAMSKRSAGIRCGWEVFGNDCDGTYDRKMIDFWTGDGNGTDPGGVDLGHSPGIDGYDRKMRVKVNRLRQRAGYTNATTMGVVLMRSFPLHGNWLQSSGYKRGYGAALHQLDGVSHNVLIARASALCWGMEPHAEDLVYDEASSPPVLIQRHGNLRGAAITPEAGVTGTIKLGSTVFVEGASFGTGNAFTMQLEKAGASQATVTDGQQIDLTAGNGWADGDEVSIRATPTAPNGGPAAERGERYVLRT